ncbi:hypothetical protein SAMN04489752_2851 [Brevibacterium siliguriense]|uniref:Uncharacterized protein n=1 Tax=Brevibacterium siliguriense TaxID=1136497 RepID=A0A1H1W5F9_9MICO|nr:hypothetical protein SAMN04489752_2851 [Brevibacterium siliguriense]
MATVVMMSVVSVIHGHSVFEMPRFSRLDSVMLMFLLFVHTPNLYP